MALVISSQPPSLTSSKLSLSPSSTLSLTVISSFLSHLSSLARLASLHQ